MCHKSKDKKAATPKTAKASAGSLWLKEIRSGMKSASVPLLLTTAALGSLYQCPSLYWSLFRCGRWCEHRVGCEAQHTLEIGLQCCL